MKTGNGLLIILIGYAAVCFISTVNAGAAKPQANKKSGAKTATRKFTEDFQCVNDTFKGDTYLYCAKPLMTWFEAFQQCCEMGGDLPVADNKEFLEFMKKFVRKTKYQEGWAWTAGMNFFTGPGSSYIWYTRQVKGRISIADSLWADPKKLSPAFSCAKAGRRGLATGLYDAACHESQGMSCKLN